MTSSQGIRAGRAYVEISAVDRFSRTFDAAEARLRSFSDGMLTAASDAAAPGLSILAPLAAATASFAAFDDQMRKVAALAGGTEAGLRSLTATAEHLGQTTSYTAAQVAALMVELARGGMNTSQIDAATESVLALARATDTDAPQAAEILIATMNQFGLAASDAGRIADVLTMAANRSAVSVGDLGESLKYAGPVARDLGLSLEDTVAILAQLGNFGIRGSEAGTSLRRIGLLATTNADKLRTLFDVSNADAAGNLRPLVDILDDIGTSVSRMSQVDGVSALEEAFGILGITSASVISQTGDGVRGLAADLASAGGTAIQTAQEMDGGIGGAFRRFISAMEGAVNAVGKQQAGPLISFGGAVSRILLDLTEWIRENQTLVVGLGVFGGACLAAAAALVAVAVAGKTMLFALFALKAIAVVTILVGKSSMALIAFAGILRMVSGVMKAATLLVGGLGRAWAGTLGLMGAARAGVLAMTAALSGASGASAAMTGATVALNAAHTATPGLVGMATAAYALLRGALSAVLSPAHLATRMAAVVGGAWKAAGIAARTAWIAVLSPLLAFAAKALIAVGIIYGIGAAMVAAARQAGTFSTLFSLLGAQFTKLLSIVKTTFGGITAAIQSGDYSGAVRVLWAGIRAAFWTGAETVMIGLGYFLANGLDEVVAFGKALISILWNVFRSIPSMLMSALRGGKNLKSILADALQGDLARYNNFYSAVQRRSEDARRNLTQLVSDQQAAILARQQERLAEAEAEAAKGTEADQLTGADRAQYDSTEARIAALRAAEENQRAADDRLAALKRETTELELGEAAAQRHAFALQVAGDATKLAAYDAAVAAKQQAEMASGIAERIAQLEHETRVIRQGEAAAQRYALSVAGATAAQLQALQDAQDAKDAAQRHSDLQADADSLRDAMRTPLEVFRDEMTRLHEMRSAGVLDPNTGQRAAAKLRDDLLDAADTQEERDKIWQAERRRIQSMVDSGRLNPDAAQRSLDYLSAMLDEAARRASDAGSRMTRLAEGTADGFALARTGATGRDDTQARIARATQDQLEETRRMHRTLQRQTGPRFQ